VTYLDGDGRGRVKVRRGIFPYPPFHAGFVEVSPRASAPVRGPPSWPLPSSLNIHSVRCRITCPPDPVQATSPSARVRRPPGTAASPRPSIRWG